MSLGLLLFSARPGQATGNTITNPLKFFKNYFVTGDYVVGGVGLRGTGVNGFATGTIPMSGVPNDAEILAAFLYWQVVYNQNAPDFGSTGVEFNGNLLSSPDGPLGKALAETTACTDAGDGGSSRRTYTYRADVLRFLDVDGGRYVVNTNHTVKLPDSGSGNYVPKALGASLLVIYRHPDPATSLSAIVIYDGGLTLSSGSMSQAIKGFYDPKPGKSGKMTHIVGNGQSGRKEYLRVPGSSVFNPFQAFQGSYWDNVTRTTTPATGPSVTTSVDYNGVSSSSKDCLSWGAIVYRTEVKDTDGDGLLDTWESSTVPLKDPNDEFLPHLWAMGADPQHKDIFIEVGYLETTGPVTYGGVSKDAHTHRPTPTVLKMVGDAFRDAPVTNPDGYPGIDVHFDVGDPEPTWDPDGVADPYILGVGVRGGESMNELDTTETCVPEEEDPAPWICQFSAYPGTVGWKSGFRFIKDELINNPANQDLCDAPGNDGPGEPCERRFDRNRKDTFRYALFAHALGVPKDDCLGDDGFPADTCLPDYHVPVTNTGVGDFSGADLLMTLGAFPDPQGRPVGTDFMVASTILHELGHTFARRHGGDDLLSCKTNYLSVMNYLFQLRGLRDDNGVPHVDFSGQTLQALDENALTEFGVLGVDLPYQTAWYAPRVQGTIGFALGLAAAKRHCDGTELLQADPPMVRIDGVADGIDWNGNGVPDSSLSLDINFNGALDGQLKGSNDWANIRLNQIGSRRNVGGWFYVPDPESEGEFVAFIGPMSLDVGRGDLGRGDLGRGDLGRGDLGRGDLGRGDLGRGDLGRGDLGRGDLGRGDLGRGDLGRGDLGRGDLGRGDLGVGADEGAFELDFETATALGNTPPNELKACVIGEDPDCPVQPLHRIELEWKAPNVGAVSEYSVYRVTGATVTPENAAEKVPVGIPSASTSRVDNEELPDGVSFTYFVVATFTDGTVSDPSNFATIEAVNDPPEAIDDLAETNQDTPVDVVVVANDTDPDTALNGSLRVAAGSITGVHGGTAVLQLDGRTVRFTPDPGGHSNNTPGGFGFSYRGNNGTWSRDPNVSMSADSNVATVSITVKEGAPGVGRFWMGLKNSDDQGTWFDIKAEVFVNDNSNPVAEGVTRCVTGITRNPAQAKEVMVPLGSLSVGPGDVKLKVSTRIGTNPDGSMCGGHSNAVGLRLYYDAVSRKSGFTLDGVNQYLHSNGNLFFNAIEPTGDTAKQKDSASIKFQGGNPWMEIGTWTRQ